MAPEAVTPLQPGQRTLPDRTGQRGQRAAAASSSRAGCTQGPRPRLRGPWALIFTVLGVLLLVKPASAMSVRKDEIHQQSSAPLEWSPQEKLCPPGFYMEEAIGGCAPCTYGIDYTNHSNTLPSCLLCTTCKPGEEEKNRCTPTKDTECQCKPGTFRGEDAPEFCQKCSTGCPDGKVMVMNCTPLSNVKCMDQESGPSHLVIGIVTAVGLGIIVLIGCVVRYCLKGPFNECWHKVIGFSRIGGIRPPVTASQQSPRTRSPIEKLQTTMPSPEMQQADCLLKPAAPQRISEEKTAAGSNRRH